MKKECFAVFILNERSGHLKLFGLYDSEDFASSVVEVLEDSNHRNYINIFYSDVSFSYTKKLLDETLLNQCFNIANVLYLSDRAFAKCKFDKFKYWQDVARQRALYASSILDKI